VDFKEVFKWITSHLIASDLGVKANLDGKFIVNVKLSHLPEEEKLFKELSEFSIVSKTPSGFNPAKKRHDNKKNQVEGTHNVAAGEHKDNLIGIQEVIKIFESTPLGLISRI